MPLSIATIIERNEDLDIIVAFRRLATQSAKMQALEQLAALCEKRSSHLFHHRCLLTLARLLEELAEEFTQPACSDDLAAILALLRRCSGMGLESERVLDLRTSSLTDLTIRLAASLSTKAAVHLRKAIVEYCPAPDDYLNTIDRAPISFRNASIYTQAPVRLDLGMAGISDIPPYSLERYGNCVNVPVRLDGHWPLGAKAGGLTEPIMKFLSRDMGESKTYDNISEFDDEIPALLFHKEVVRFFLGHIMGWDGAEALYAFQNGGLCVESHSRLPVGTGLGVSSLLLCTILKAVSGLFDISLTPETLFVASVYLENVTGIGGGWEDATAVYPGVKLMESFPEFAFSPRPKALVLKNPTIQKLRGQLLLVHTGIPKQGQAFFDKMVERYCLRQTQTLQAIERNNRLNQELSELLVAGDLVSVGRIMQSQWENWKVLSDGKCTNPQIDRLFAEVGPHIHGARINGAGQGGCAMLMIRHGEREKVERAVQSVLGESVKPYRWEPVL